MAGNVRKPPNPREPELQLESISDRTRRLDHLKQDMKKSIRRPWLWHRFVRDYKLLRAEGTAPTVWTPEKADTNKMVVSDYNLIPLRKTRATGRIGARAAGVVVALGFTFAPTAVTSYFFAQDAYAYGNDAQRVVSFISNNLQHNSAFASEVTTLVEDRALAGKSELTMPLITYDPITRKLSFGNGKTNYEAVGKELYQLLFKGTPGVNASVSPGYELSSGNLLVAFGTVEGIVRPKLDAAVAAQQDFTQYSFAEAGAVLTDIGMGTLSVLTLKRLFQKTQRRDNHSD